MKKIIVFIIIVFFPCIVESATTIDCKVIRNQTGTGSCLISSGFPLPPGLVTEQIIQDGRVQILIDSTEVVANVSALRGRHSDGTLRSMLIQFNHSMAQGADVDAQVVIGGNRRVQPNLKYTRPTLAIITNNNIIAATSSTYLSSTGIYFRSVLKTGDGSAAEEQLYTALAADRFDALALNEEDGGARYEEISAMIGMWSRSGTIKYWNEALKKTLEWLPYNTPVLLGEQTPLDHPCRNDAVINPDARTGGQGCAGYAEWEFARTFSYAQMYLLTGYRDFWGIVAYFAQLNQAAISSQALAYTTVIQSGANDLPRFNYSTSYGGMLAALMIDATILVDAQWSSGRVFNWQNQIQWTIDAIEYTAWDLKWIPFDSGSGTIPDDGTTISQGGVSATLLGVYATTHDPKASVASSTMPASGYLQVKSITGGSFSAGALTGISASATGAEESDYRQGMTGTRSNSPRAVNLNPYTVIPTFQLVFITNFLIDTYLYAYSDSRIPDMVKANVDIILQNIRLMVEGDSYYGASGGVWGDPLYGHPYKLEKPVATDDARPYTLPEYARMVAFVLKTKGEATVNGANYTTWYSRLINTGNISPEAILIWQWKLFGQFYGWGQDAPWIMSQTSISNPMPTMRTPTQWNSIPGDTPDLEMTGTIRGVGVSGGISIQ